MKNLACLAVLLTLAGCNPHMKVDNRPDVVRAANDFAIARRIDLSKYEAPEVRQAKDHWVVIYEGKSRAPGAHFSVLVEMPSVRAYDLQLGQ